MKSWMHLSSALVSVFALGTTMVACASKSKIPSSEMSDAKTASFEQGMRALEHDEFEDAAQIFDQLLVQNPASEIDLVILYDSGAAYEGMGNCSKAIDRYRAVVRSSAGRFKRVESEALYRSSLMYECLGQDTKAIASLLDVRKRGQELPYEVQNAEIPARLAAAYARIGNRDKALQYFNQASRGLKQVVSQSGRGIEREKVSHTLYLMGRLSPTQRSAGADPNTYLQSLSMQQPYLLQAMEINNMQWSNNAAEDLKQAYDNIWKFKFTDPEQHRAFYTRAILTINELSKIRMPKPDPRIDDVFAMLDRTRLKLQNELSLVAEKVPLTPEAQRRDAPRRTGRLVNPEPESDSKAKAKKPTPR